MTDHDAETDDQIGRRGLDCDCMLIGARHRQWNRRFFKTEGTRGRVRSCAQHSHRLHRRYDAFETCDGRVSYVQANPT